MTPDITKVVSPITREQLEIMNIKASLVFEYRLGACRQMNVYFEY